MNKAQMLASAETKYQAMMTASRQREKDNEYWLQKALELDLTQYPRQDIQEEATTTFYTGTGYRLEEIIPKIQELLAGAKVYVFEVCDDEVNIVAALIRPETDKEMRDRLVSGLREISRKERIERETLRKLKEKYEPEA